MRHLSTESANGSCAGLSIKNLGLQGGPKQAMIAFCLNQIGFLRLSYAVNPTAITPWVTWIAGPEIPGQGHSQPWVRYGTEFAEFIRENKLGEVTTLPAKINKRYHPDTTCQMWLWSPDDEALNEWWKNNKPSQEEVDAMGGMG